MFENMKSETKSWWIRNISITAVIALLLWILGFESIFIMSIVAGILFVTVAIGLSGWVIWAFTRLKFIDIGDTRAIVEIFKGVCILLASILIGYYFVFNQPSEVPKELKQNLDKLNSPSTSEKLKVE